MSHPTFRFSLHRDSASQPFFASCTIIGETAGLSPATRRFTSADEITSALKRSGIEANRYKSAMTQVRKGADATIDINQNEAQKLGVLHTDTSE